MPFRYPGIEAALARLEDAIAADGPYDALLGFSMGGILITLLTALRLKAARDGGGAAAWPSWRANACVCAMPVRDDAYRALFAELGPLDFPATLAFGTSDPLYPWCRRLTDAYRAPDVVEYADGHRFPHAREESARLAESLRRQLAREG